MVACQSYGLLLMLLVVAPAWAAQPINVVADGTAKILPNGKLIFTPVTAAKTDTHMRVSFDRSAWKDPTVAIVFTCETSSDGINWTLQAKATAVGGDIPGFSNTFLNCPLPSPGVQVRSIVDISGGDLVTKPNMTTYKK